MTDKALRAQLVKLLDFEEAHVGFDRAVKGIPPRLRGDGAGGRRALAVAAARAPADRAGRHPRVLPDRQVQRKEMAGRLLAGVAGAAQRGGVDAAIAGYRRDRKAFQRLAANPKIDLFAAIPHGTGQTYLREILLAADHAAYHIGQIVAVRRQLGIWSSGSREAPFPISQDMAPARGADITWQRLRTQRLVGAGFTHARQRRALVRRRSGAGLFRRAVGGRHAHDRRDRGRRRTGDCRTHDRPHMAAARHAAFRGGRRCPLDADTLRAADDRASGVALRTARARRAHDRAQRRAVGQGAAGRSATVAAAALHVAGARRHCDRQ